MTVICEDLCKDCAVHFMKNPEILGDYDIGGTLLRYCPLCGQMLPFLEISLRRESDDISNTQKRRVGVRVAKKNNLDFVEVYNVIKNLKDIKKEKDFVRTFEIELKRTFNLHENVKSFL